MKPKLLLFFLIFSLQGIFYAKAEDAPFRFVGGDISLLPDYEEANAKYYDSKGKPIKDVLQFCFDEGMNCMRVRLFVDPDAYLASNEKADPNAKQDLEYITPLCRRIQEAGMALMLDFHYSDTWADPAKQWTPLSWQGLSDLKLFQKIYDYTKETLESLKEAGVVPEFIQTGNEISYGMLWGPEGSTSNKVYPDSNNHWGRFINLLRNAIKACREVCPDAEIVIHNERVARLDYLLGFYNKLKDYDLDYDIIGLSYYPYFHGSLSVLDEDLNALEDQFPDKEIMIVETGYPYKWEVPGTTEKVDYPYTEAGQAQFAKDLVDMLLAHPTCTGLFWWWMEYNAKGTTLSNWYNAPLFDSGTGRVTKAFAEICAFGSGHYEAGIGEVFDSPTESGAWYDLQGRAVANPTLPGLYIHNGKKIMVK